ncbi:MAG: carbon-nitrogen hydrolase family protein [Caldilineaceae bacterium]
MTRNVTIAAIQLPIWTEGETTAQQKRFKVEAIMHWLEEAGKAKVDLACLGETCTGEIEVEEAYTGPTTRMVQKLAAHYQMHVILPLHARVDGILRNTALVIDSGGQIVGRYDKVHPTRRELRDGVVPGSDFPVFDLAFGRIGVCICHDLSFPESARVLGVRGAEIIVWPTLWSGWGEELCYAVIRSRAIDNAAWLVNTTYGIESHKAWRPGMILGRSGVIGPDGLILSNVGRYVGMALCTVDLDHPRIAHDFSFPGDGDARTSLMADRRPDAYGPLIDPSLVTPPAPPPGFYATAESTAPAPMPEPVQQ